MKIEHLDSVRGGRNEYARLFLHIVPAEKLTADEQRAIFSPWDEEFGLCGHDWSGHYYTINTRREFALIPAIIRKALRVGFDVAQSQWSSSDGDSGTISLARHPVEFWQALALAQMWFKTEEEAK